MNGSDLEKNRDLVRAPRHETAAYPFYTHTAAELPSWRVHSQRARGLGDPIRQHSPQQKSRRAAVSIAEQHQRPLAGSPQAGAKLHLTPACRSNPGTKRPREWETACPELRSAAHCSGSTMPPPMRSLTHV